MKLLILSNGHGEDAIAARIAEQIQLTNNPPELAILPLVGEGHAYDELNIPVIGAVQKMPSGGFIYMDSRELLKDLKGGLLQLTLKQYQAIQQWAKDGGKILAVGDIVPLIFAWMSGAEYGFVGTAKSEYYLRDKNGWLTSTPWFARQLGSDYYPWERWLMSRPNCKAVFPRDEITANNLQQFSIPAFDLGNPMMDGLGINTELPKNKPEQLTILLLPGSRSPEAERNWQVILQAVQGILEQFQDQSLCFLAAIAPSLDLKPLQQALIAQKWQSIPLVPENNLLNDVEAKVFQQKQSKLILSQRSYGTCLNLADLAIAMAGTATEQFVGLGKPVFSLPGTGPQFTPAFAQRQTYLLGKSVTLLSQPSEVAQALKLLLNNPEKRLAIAENGKKRLGKPGAAARIAHCLREIWG
ncbi:MAG: lipid-A-disaccharide synthase-related protein [Snowella sp.]|nr:lipid-A-disaccharide synthase-related protein [Snowella sp.]